MTRGIMCTIYTDLLDLKDIKEVIELYTTFYNDHPFVRIRKEGNLPSTKEVYGSNFCDIGIHVDERTGKLVLVSVIDNLIKGAAGQAVQNLNVMNGWDVRTGLMNVPVYP
jgi:N-acetyl-gamma-glutamyl-phosphate reductase